MAASSKSSQTAKNIVMALLAIWSIISLIVIVVWATSPVPKTSAQCYAELQEVTERLEGGRVVWTKDKQALEEKVMEEREKVEQHKVQILLLHQHLNASNASLEECQQEKVVLMGNISLLQENMELLRRTQKNLTTELSLREEHIEALQQNLTQAFHRTNACRSLNDAARSETLAAKSQTKACEAQLQHHSKQLQKCRSDAVVAKQIPPQQQEQDKSSSASGLRLPALMLHICSALHLLT
ncbi:uncharacterized protein si:ch211-1a19.3 [Betta splendens]|uniref:Uncharacterized protein si:ch211-1a19.3 n=1 Tax=Betta splendens TaxID=158456 RepID=A0A6P7M819_BETSP|nr:uncharacterized protein si:ch211-1a19.3 [Betta splendens]